MSRLSLSLLGLSLLAACATPEGGPAGVSSPSRYWGQPLQASAADAPRAASAPLEEVRVVSAEPPASAVPAEASPAVALQDDLDPTRTVGAKAPEAHTDLWLRVRAGLALPDLSGERVEKWEAYYARRPDYVQRMTERGGRYLFHIVEEVQKRGLPMELALLPFIESAFNPEAMSHARASGMWQFMSATGKDFDLKQNLFRDDRRDVLASTRAALDYLAQLGRRYDGDWQLALAAYNWGMGNVDRAVKRARAAGLAGSYEELRMPVETADYVPKLQAVKNIVLRPEAYGLALPTLDNHPYFLSVRIERDIDVELAARLAGLSVERFRQFNPQMNKPVILAAATPSLLLPYDNAERFAQALAAHRGPMASWTAWQVPRAMKVAEAAKQAGMTEAGLRALNNIPPRMRVQAGSTLLVPRTAKRDHDVSEHLADTARLALTPEQQLRKRVVKARKGDTVAKLARRHGVSAARVAEWNGLSASAALKGGQSVTLMLPARAKSASAKAPARKASARAAPARAAKRS